MKFKSSIILLVAMLLTQSAWSTDRFHIFTAIKVGAKRTSNLDIHEYIEATRFKPDVKKRIFVLADQDWDKYQEMMSEQYEVHYDDALKELAYAKLLEHEATSSFRQNGKRQSFLTTENEYFEELQKRESQALKQYLDKRLGIVEARKRFGQDLMDQGFPHKMGEAPEDVYWRWYEDQKQIIRESFRKQEVLRHEYVEATLYNKDLRFRPTALSDLKKELDSIIDEQLHGKKLPKNKINSILSSHPALKHRISKLHLLSLEEEPLAKIKELDGPEFKKYLTLIRKSVPELRKQSFLERLIKYEEISAALAQKYNDPQKLNKLSEKSLTQFVEGGTYNDFMMSRLYSLASNLTTSKTKREESIENLIGQLKQALPELLKRLSSAKTYEKEQNKSLLFENVVANELNQILNTTELEGHLKELTDMAVWVVKFEAKKITLEKEPKVIVQKTSYDTFETYKKLSDYLKRQEYMKGLRDYHNDRLTMSSYLLELKTKSGQRLRGPGAYKYIMGDKI